MTAQSFLRNETIKLRAVEPGDARFMWDVDNDSSQWIQNGMLGPVSFEAMSQFANTYDPDPFHACQLRLIAEKINTGERVGIVDLYDISVTNRTAFVGIYILPQYRRQKYAASALCLLEEYARKLLSLRILGAKTVADNISSIRLFESLSYIRAGELRGWIRTSETTRSLYIYQKYLETP